MLNLGKIDHIHVRVDDIGRALGWYQRVLGLSPDVRVRKTNGSTMLANTSGTIRLALVLQPAPACAPGSVSFVVSGQDFLEWLDQLAGERVKDRAGETVARDSVEDHASYLSVAFVDPFGNPYEIISYDYTWLAGKLKLASRSVAG
ncbi:VOC family protein [Craterilacuibacter sp.]|uniref:VOC family protein n=1 Tax=Craterilacuibacter sp. TaxID=2870909 RepID=UPI003F382D13